MSSHRVQPQPLSRSHLLRSVFTAALVCLSSAFFLLAPSAVQAASSARTTSGFKTILITPQNVRQYLHETLVPRGGNALTGTSSPGQCLSGTRHIYSLANNLAVAAELGGTGDQYGLLRARTDPLKIGPWEAFTICAGLNGAWEIQSNANGLFVAAEMGGTGDQYARLRARTPPGQIGPWEQFYIYEAVDSNSILFEYFESASNDLVVAAELGGTGDQYARLRARTPPGQIGPWEEFNIYPLDGLFA